MKLTRLCLILFALTLSAYAQAADTGWVIVTGEVCNIRSKPDSSSKLVVELKTFTPIKLTGEKEGEYYAVETHAGKTGWAHEKVLGKYGYASAKPEMINWRTGPGKEYDIRYELNNRDYYPVRVLDRQGEYVLTLDMEKDKGWMHSSMLTTKAYCAVSVEKANILIDARDDAEVRFHATKGVVLEILNEKGDWLEVKHRGGNSGWINASDVWGGKKISVKDMPASTKPAKPANATQPAEESASNTESSEPETVSTETAEKVTKKKAAAEDEEGASADDTASEAKSAKSKKSKAAEAEEEQ